MKRYRAIAEYYDAENAHHAMLQQDIAFFLSRLPRRRQNILELAVGTGRAAIPIVQAGHRVIGIDYAKDMLAIAQRKRDSVGLSERDLRLLNGDVLKFRRRERFDWICIFFNTFLAFSTLEQQDRFLQIAVSHLKRSGRLWLDIFQPNLALLADKAVRGLDPCAFYVPRYQRTVFKTTDIRRSLERQVQRVSFNYLWFDDRGRARRERLQFDMTWIFPRELQILLERNGLRIERLFGNYDGSDVGPASPRLIASCRLA